MKIYPVFIPNAGCPHQCLFCAQDRTTSQAEVPVPQRVEVWLDETLPQQGAGEIAFYGGTFSMLPIPTQDAYLYSASQFLKAGRAASIRISTRPDAIDDACLDRLHHSGVRTIEIGCQSFSDEVLLASGRGHNSADCKKAVLKCRDKGFAVGVQLMPGLPGDDVDAALTSLRAALNLKPEFLRIYPTVVVAGTGLADLWQSGEYEPWSLEMAVEICAEMLTVCQRENIPVIRLGLQRDPQLEANLLAGPYHPAFGQLVRSRLWRRLLAQAGRRGHELTVHPNDYSDVIGHRGENRSWFKANFKDLTLTVDHNVKRGFLHIAGQDLPLLDTPKPGARAYE